MRVVVSFDGSASGLQALRVLLSRISAIDRVTTLVVTWPERLSALWDDAIEQSALTDDLHQSMAETAAKDQSALRGLFPDTILIEARTTPGDPVECILAEAKRTRADMIVLGVVGGIPDPSKTAAASILRDVVVDAECVVVVVHGVSAAELRKPDGY